MFYEVSTLTVLWIFFYLDHMIFIESAQYTLAHCRYIA